MSGIRRFFPVEKQRKSPQKPSREPSNIHELLDSSDDDDIDIIGVKHASQNNNSQKIAQGNAHAKDARSAVEAKPKTEDKKPLNPAEGTNIKHETGTQKGSQGDGHGSFKTAAEVLASIPSAELPKVDESAKPNFRQIIGRQSQESSNSGEMPDIEAAPQCLTGLTFVVTGQLPTLGRDEIQNLIKRYGGHVTSSISGKTSCLVLGEDAGPSKIQKAKKLKLKVIDEAGFLQLLRSMPADGGSGEAAEHARAKRKKDEVKIEQEAKRLKKSENDQANRQEFHRQQVEGSDKSHKHSGDDAELWTTKYAPHQMSDICGNNAAVQRLSKWLQNWRAARNGTYKGEGSEFRAAMLSGPPGIGKTTAAHLIGELQGYDIVEYNASDTRSKSLLQSQVSRTLNNSTLGLTDKRDAASPSSLHELHTRKLLVIMDEVDGMSGGDRGGVGAMASFARTSNVPLILVCNERTLPKMRPFDRVVFDIPFRRPDASQVRHRLMAIARAQGLELDPSSVDQLVAVTRSDIRQMLNLLEMYSTTDNKMSYDGSRKFSKNWNKEVVLKPFDIAGKLLSRGAQNSMTTNERMELYFHDYDFAPLMIQENYVVTSPSIAATAEAATAISDGDLVDKRIHGSQQQWSLMPLHALLSCVEPSYYAAGQARGRFNFTSYLGNNSKGLKYRRLLAELRSHMRMKLAGNAVDLRLEYQPLLAYLLLSPLLKKGSEAIPEVIEFMDHYFITKDDWDVIMELGVGVNKNTTETMAKGLPTAVKTAFTRRYNSMAHPLPFMKSVDTKAAATTGRKPEAPDLDDVIAEDEPDEPEQTQDNDDLETAVKNDKYIKAGKAKAKPKAKAVKKPRAKK